ncbi:MAG: methyl-accepting chemotaxis protein [Spirochaetaceae bacterium]
MIKMQIKTRILGSFILILMLLSAVSFISIRSGNIINRTLIEIKEDNLETTLAFMDFGKSVDQISVILLRTSASENKKGVNDNFIPQIDEWYQNGLKNLSDVKIILNKKDQTEVVSQLLANIELLEVDFKDYRDRGVLMTQAYMRTGSMVGNMFMKKSKDTNEQFSSNINSLIAENLLQLDEAFAYIRVSSLNSMKLSIITVIVGIILGIIFGFLISSSISNPIKDIVDLTQKMASGDITERVNISEKNAAHNKNETYILSVNFNNFADSLSSILHKITDLSSNNRIIKDTLVTNSDNCSSSVVEISANIDNIKKQVDYLDSSIKTSNSAVERINENTKTFKESFFKQIEMEEESTSAITEMTASIKSVSNIATEKQKAVEKLVETAKEGSSKLENTVNIIDDIDRSLGKINEMVELIDGIAAQTNLLSMNAAIEAAHAGDAGKGFAVVSGEIGKLADSSKNSVDAITGTIKEVADNIHKAVDSGRETKLAFDEINKVVVEVTQALSEISASTEELSIGSNMILESIGKLHDISGIVKDESNEIVNNSETVSESMENVKQISQVVSIAITEIQLGIKTIFDSMSGIESLSENLDVVSNELDSEITKFKISDV